MSNAKKLKAELLELRMKHPELLAEFGAAKAALWKAEERMDRIEVELRLLEFHRTAPPSSGGESK